MATVVCGSYERFVFGYRVDGLPGSGGGAGGCTMARSFTADAHLTHCKSVAAQGGFIASGGADDLIRVWHHNPDGGLADLGTLSGHEGTVSCVQFHSPNSSVEPTRLVSGSVDGTIIIWSVGKWDNLKTLKAHRGGVHALSVHRSGAVAMSAGADSHLAMWDMRKGRVAHKLKMKVKPELLAFTPSGNSYATVAGSRLTITSAESGAMTGVFDTPARVMCMAQAGTDNLALLGLEGGNIVGYDTRVAPTKPALTITKAHPTRVKGMVVPLDDSDATAVLGGPAGGPVTLVSASSEGVVRLWDLRTAGKSGAAAALAAGVTTARDEPLAEVKGGGRFTCMATMPTALPSTVAAAVMTERGTRHDPLADPALKAAKKKEDKARKIEKARAMAARRPEMPPPSQRKKTRKGSADVRGSDRDGEPASRSDGFEIVAEPEDFSPVGQKKKSKLAGQKRSKASEPEAIGAGISSDEPLVQKKPGFKTASGKKGGAAGGRSYEEVATAARRKGSGVKKAKPSRGFAKPSRG